MNFDNNPVNINASLDSAIMAYQQNQFDRAEAECKSFLQANPGSANAQYLFGLILQKQGKNDLAIDYINKAISTDAAQIAAFQSKLLAPVQQNVSAQTNEIPKEAPQMSSPQMSSPQQTQTDDDPFKATRELLKRFEQEQSTDNIPANNQSFESNQQPFWEAKEQQSTSMNVSQSSTSQSITDNSALINFIQELYTENFSATVLFWTGVESRTIGNLNQFPGMKFSVWHDEIKSHEYYTDFLKDLKLRSMSVITSDKAVQTQWDAFILPYTEIDCPEDPVCNVSYKSLYLANGFMNAPDKQIVEAKLKSKGCVPKGNDPCVFERKDQLAKGETLFNEGKVEEAIQCFEEVLASDPNNTDAYNNLGVVSYALGNAESAETFFLKALEIDPKNVNALMNIADVYSACGHINEAATFMTKAIELEPKNPNIWASLSSFYKQIGSEEESQAAMKKSEALRQSANQ
jgi:tetratricopeptide (TPR) repeat protein